MMPVPFMVKVRGGCPQYREEVLNYSVEDWEVAGVVQGFTKPFSVLPSQFFQKRLVEPDPGFEVFDGEIFVGGVDLGV